MWGISLLHPVLPSFLSVKFFCGEFLLHIPCCLHFYLGSFSYTSRAGFFFFFLFYLVLSLFFCVEFLLHIPCCLHFYLGRFRCGVSLTHPVLASYLDSFPYISSAGFILIWGVSPKQPMLASFFIWGVSLTHPMLTLFLCGEFVLHIPCYLHFYLGRFMWGVSLTHPVLPSFLSEKVYVGSFSYTSRVAFIFIWEGLCGEFLLHIPCCLHFYLRRFMWEVSLTHPVLPSFLSGKVYVGSFSYTSRVAFIFIWEGLCGKFLLHIPCCLHFYLRRFMWEVSLTHPVLPSFLSGKVYVGSFSYTSRVAFIFIWEGLCGKFLLHIPCCLHFYLGRFMWGVSLTHPVLPSFLSEKVYVGSFSYTSRVAFIFIWEGLCGKFLLHIPCCLHFYLGRFMWGVSLTHPVLPSFLSEKVYVGSFSYTSRVAFIFIWEGLCGEFLLHIPCCLHFYLRRFMWEVSLTHPVLPSFLSEKVYVGSFSYTSRVAFIFIWEGLCGEFLLHIPCCLHFYLRRFMWEVSLTHPVLPSFLSGKVYVGSFSYTSHAGFIFIVEVFLTHPVLALVLSGEFLLHIPCWLHFYLRSFSYTSRVGFTFIWGVSLTHPKLAFLFCGEFLLHTPCWIHFSLGSFS